MNVVDVVECVGSLTGVSGSWVLALKFRYSRFGWCLYLVSNICMISFAVGLGRQWLLLQGVGFLLSSLVGVWNYVVVDRFPRLPAFDGSVLIRRLMVRKAD